MKANTIVFNGPRQAGLVALDVPDPGNGECTIQTLVTLLSLGTELTCYRGDFTPGGNWANWVQYPFYPGYSCVGRIIKVGNGVEGLTEGDRIFCREPHRQFATLPIERDEVVRVPDDITEEEAAWCKLASITQTGVRLAEHAMGDTAVVIGLGPLGQLITQYLRLLGLREVLVIDPIQPRLDRALNHGATRAFCGSASDAVEFVRQHTGGELADVVYDVTGHPAVFPAALPLARRFGKVVLQGDTPHPARQHLTQDVLTRQLRIMGSHNENLPPEHAAWTVRRQEQLFLHYLQRKQMSVADLITHRFDPRDAADVYAQFDQDRGDSAGVIFDWR